MKLLLVRTSVVCLAFAAGASAQTPAGGEFRVNTYTTGYQNLARAAMDADGDFVVVWVGDQPAGIGDGVFGQRFAASGAPRGGEFQINTYTAVPDEISVAVGSKGDFVVVWVSDQDGSGRSIQGRRYDASGSAIGGEFLVNSYTTGNQYRPNVGRAGDGRFVVCWTGQLIDGSDGGIAARRFDASGNAIGSDFVVNTYTTNFQVSGNIAVEANGNFVVVWEDLYNNRDGSGPAVFGQRYDASANRLGSEFQVNTFTTAFQFSPSISASPAGGFVVVWASELQDGSNFGVAARRYDALGDAVGNDFIVNTYTTGNQFGFRGQVAHDARGNFVVTWFSRHDGSSYGSFAQRFTASGAFRGAEFRVNSYTTDEQILPSIASDAVGNFVDAWDSLNQDGSTFGVYAQRFGGLFPVALTVDTPGNRVLEPGETVDMRPSWRNLNGVPQTFSGTLNNFTGPAGASYVIIDSGGNYGTVANGATVQAINWYEVMVTNPPTRPVVHWDAAVVENILPDTQGQQKPWLLHVGRSFTDVPTSNGFYRFIETLLHHGITGGCGPTQYCPASATTREQMSVFVLVAKEGAGYAPPACGATPTFLDVPASHPFCRWIEELARRGVVSGCGGGNYCPTSEVTREQMAVFVLRTLDPALLPPLCAPPNIFNDVPETSGFCRWIEELANRGVVTGCGGGNYCPTGAVTREQMGVFISGTFGLTLYGP